VTGLVERLRAAGCVFAEDEARLITSTARSAAELETMAKRRVSGEPLEHVLGWAEFCGHRITVSGGVFVPRRRTEWLVRTAAALAPFARVVVDLCTGTGAVAVAVAATVRPEELHAADIDPAAVDCARRNLTGIGEAYCGDLFDALPEHLRRRIDLLTVNAPYVPSDHIRLLPAEAREHEPRAALDGGADGLVVHRRVIDGAPSWLAPGGVLVLELAPDQAASAVRTAESVRLLATIRTSDELEATVVVARRPP
jgi:release factor glutamine methyltransferase